MEPVIKLNPGATKWDIRQKVWDYIEANNLAHFPRPVHNRIPNFKGAGSAGDRLPALAEFKCSKVVKVNPDRPQQQARYVTLAGAHCACAAVAELESFHRTVEVKVDPDKPLEGARLVVLQARKTLLVPTPRLRSGLFNRIVPPQGASKEDLHVCSTSQGVKNFSVPVGLEAKVRVDLVVVGSVAVSEKGYRIGKGEGYADMEYAMMVSMEAVSSAAVVVTVVHDCQVVDIPEELIENHDLTVDYILTPTRVIQTECKRPKPQGIIWTKLNADMLERIPVLQKLRALELKSGKDVSLGRADFPGEVGPPGGGRADTGVDDRAVTTLYLGGVPAGLRVGELKSSLRERDALPQRLIWQGENGRAFLDYGDHHKAQAALTALQALSINGHNMQVAFARGQRSRRRPGVPHRTGKVAESQTPNRSLKRS